MSNEAESSNTSVFMPRRQKQLSPEVSCFQVSICPILEILKHGKKNYLDSKMEGKIFMVKGHCELTIFKNSDTT